VPVEQTDEWTESRRYMGPDLLAHSRLRVLAHSTSRQPKPQGSLGTVRFARQTMNSGSDLLPRVANNRCSSQAHAISGPISRSGSMYSVNVITHWS
jgi:hypothetical protein